MPSTFIYQLLSGQGVPRDKIDVIPYGFEPEKYVQPDPLEVARTKGELNLSPEHVVFGTFGRLHEEKGHRHLLEAFAALRKRNSRVILLIVGEGPERNSIEHQVDQLDLRKCVFVLGWRRDAMTLMAAVDAIVQPTLQEAFSQVMAEAMWMGKPLLITDVSGATDIISSGVNGIIVPRGDSGALAIQMFKMAENRDLRSRLGRAGRAYIESNLLIGKIIGRFEEAYRRTMSMKIPPD